MQYALMLTQRGCSTIGVAMAAHTQQRGFTLVEVMVVIAVIIMVIIVTVVIVVPVMAAVMVVADVS